MVFVAPFGGAFAEAKLHHGGIVNDLIAFIIGSIFAMFFGWLDYKKNRWAFEWFERKKFNEIFLFALPILSIFLLISGGILGTWLTGKMVCLSKLT